MFAQNSQRSKEKPKQKKNKVNLDCLSLRVYFQMFGTHICFIQIMFLYVAALQRLHQPYVHKPEVMNWHGR